MAAGSVSDAWTSDLSPVGPLLLAPGPDLIPSQVWPKRTHESCLLGADGSGLPKSWLCSSWGDNCPRFPSALVINADSSPWLASPRMD